jgi:putative transcription antitermination factor YqgF
VIAIDLGARRIGVAITDGLGLTAQPLETIPRRGGQRDLDAIAALVRTHGAGRIVVGLPLAPDGEPGRAAKSAEAFAARLREAIASRLTRRQLRLEAEEVPSRRCLARPAKWSVRPLRLSFAGGWTPADRQVMTTALILPDHQRPGRHRAGGRRALRLALRRRTGRDRLGKSPWRSRRRATSRRG